VRAAARLERCGQRVAENAGEKSSPDYRVFSITGFYCCSSEREKADEMIADLAFALAQ
jgi:hypothetical protein